LNRVSVALQDDGVEGRPRRGWVLTSSILAYAPEIAGVMLRRQLATAVIAARQKIVEGASSCCTANAASSPL